MSSPAEQFKTAMTLEMSSEWQPSTLLIRAEADPDLVTIQIRDRTAGLIGPEQTDAVIDAIAACREKLWGPRAKGGG